MKVTFILKDFDDSFFEGCPILKMKGLLNMNAFEALEYLEGLSYSNIFVKMKIGVNNTFGERLDFNNIRKIGHPECRFNLSPRRGYKLATFEVL
jgi:hypothetical protein